jgi:hypothetical protein
MLPILERATTRDEDMESLQDRILKNLLMQGRYGLMLDVDESDNSLYIADYRGIRVINWDDTPDNAGTKRDLKLVVLDESRHERKAMNLSWDRVERQRILSFLPVDQGGTGQYVVNTVEEKQVSSDIIPSLQGRRPDSIPFVFVNATDLLPTPGEVPLLGLARLALTIYRGEADYRNSLFMSGQDTLVIKGIAAGNDGLTTVDNEGHASLTQEGEAPRIIVGTGAYIGLPQTDMDAKFIGPTSVGLQEQRQALENDYTRAEQFGLSLLTSGSQAEAEGTIGKRITARTASLQSIAKNAGKGLQLILRKAAKWMNLDENKVTVEPNLDFIDDPALPAEVLSLVTSKFRGAPLSWKTIHAYAQKGGITTLSFEDEVKEIDNEPDLNLDLNLGEPGSNNEEEEEEEENPQDEQ